MAKNIDTSSIYCHLTDQVNYSGSALDCYINVRLTQTGVTSDGKINFTLYLQRTGGNASKTTRFYTTSYVPYPIEITTRTSNTRVYTRSAGTLNLSSYYEIGSFSVTTAQLNEGLKIYLLMEVNYNSKYNCQGSVSANINTSGYIAGYTLTINKGTGVSTLTVNRDSSQIGSTGNLSSGAMIYTGDKLTVSASASDGYKLNTYTSSYTVSGALTVSVTASVLSYVLTIATVEHCTIVVTRTSSPLQGASVGVLENNATIYYNDELSIAYTPQLGYKIESSTGTPVRVEGSTVINAIVVTSNADASATVSPMATIHIWNGSSWDLYLVYVYDTNGWNLYQANVYNGSDWDRYY